MTKDAYISRLRKARQAAQEQLTAGLSGAKLLLKETGAITSDLTTKTAAALGESVAGAVEKAKQSLENEEIQQVGGRLKEVGAATEKALVDAKLQAKSLLHKSPAPESFDIETGVPEETAVKRAIERMQGRDKLGLAGEHLAGAGGTVAGILAAGSIAGAAGATTLLGSTSLAGLLGGVFVTTTPIGWVVGSAVVVGAAGYGIAKMIRSGSEQDRLRKDFIERQTQRLMALESGPASPNEKVELSQLIALTLAAEVLEQDTARRMVDLVNAGKLPTSLALERTRAIALANGLIELEV